MNFIHIFFIISTTFLSMKNVLLMVTLFLCLFSVSILRGQTEARKTVKTKSTVRKSAKTQAKTATIVGNSPKSEPNKALPVMTFDSKFHDFGTIKLGEITPVFTYNFTNTGDIPLDIDQVTGCDCSEFDWTRSAVGPGEKGFISVKFNSNKAEPEERKKKLDKYLDIVLKQTHPKTGYVIVESVKFNVFIAD